MADDIVLNAGAGGDTLAADDVAGVKYQIGKLAFGALDTAVLAIAGAGAVTTGTQRVTLASDDPAVTALQVLDNAISGSEMQVDVVAALPAGNNNIGDVDVASIAAGDNNIGNVDIVTLPATTVAGATVKTADLDTGAGTDTVPIMGVAVGAAGGAIAITGDATNGLDVDVTRVTGTVTVDGSGVTQPVSHAALTELAAAINASSQMDVNIAASAATLTVASHAVTNAGTFAVQVDGSALTSLQLIDNLVLAEDAAHVSADPGVQMLAVRKATPANVSGTDGDYEPLQVSAGRLWVDPSGVTLTVASHAVTNAGTFAVQVDGAALTSLQLLDDAISGTEMQVDVVASLPAGTNAIGKLAANSGVDIGDVDVTSISAGTNLIGDVGIQGRTTGGLSFYKSIDLDETEEEVKATAGTLYSILAFNRTAAPLYLKFYNATAANVIVGTTVPDMTLVVPANADSDGAGFTHSVAQGYAFGTAISMAVTTGVADADTGAPGANDCVVLVGYK